MDSLVANDDEYKAMQAASKRVIIIKFRAYTNRNSSLFF